MAWRDLGHVAALLNSVAPLRPRPLSSAPGYQQWERYYADRQSLLYLVAKLLIDVSDCGAAARSMLEGGSDGG